MCSVSRTRKASDERQNWSFFGVAADAAQRSPLHKTEAQNAAHQINMCNQKLKLFVNSYCVAVIGLQFINVMRTKIRISSSRL